MINTFLEGNRTTTETSPPSPKTTTAANKQTNYKLTRAPTLPENCIECSILHTIRKTFATGKKRLIVTRRSRNRHNTQSDGKHKIINCKIFFLFTLLLYCCCDFIQSSKPMTSHKPLPVNPTHVKTAAPVT